MAGCEQRPDEESLVQRYRDQLDQTLRAYQTASDVTKEVAQAVRSVMAGDIADVAANAERLERLLPQYHGAYDALLQTSSDLFSIYQLGMPHLTPEMSQLRAELAGLAGDAGKALEAVRRLPDGLASGEPELVPSSLASIFRKWLEETDYARARLAALLQVFDERIVLLDSTDSGSREGDAEPLDWREYIHSDRDILYGKPVVKGTRLSVAFILDLLAGGWTEEEILEEYPSLTRDALRAVFAYASDQIEEASPRLAAS